MRIFKYITIIFFLIFLQTGPVLNPVSGACDPEPVLIKELPRIGPGWSGAVAWYNGLLYETTGNVDYALGRNPDTGVPEDRIVFGSWTGNNINGFTYDRFSNTFWLKVGNYAYQAPVTGGNYIRRIQIQYAGNPARLTFGIWCDPDAENVMWCGDPTNPQIRKVNMLTGEIMETIYTTFNVRGLSRAGNTFWCVRAGELGQAGLVAQVNMSGDTICSFFLPVTKYDHDAGGCDIDPTGHLWISGGKESAIYDYNIGYVPIPPTPPPPTPPPTPAPTPVFSFAPVMDSGDYNGDGISDIAIFRGSSGLWSVRGITRIYFGRDGDLPAPGDYNGDGTTDPGLYRNTTGLWVVRGITRTYYGAAEDIPVPGDYNGDGRCDISLFRGSSGLWAVKSITRVYFGGAEDIPVPLYYGDRPSKYMAIYRPSSGLWSIRGLGRAYFGGASDHPVPANYDGSPGGMDIGIFRDFNGLWAIRGVTRVYFGRSGDHPVPGSYRGNNTTDMGIFRRSTGLWVIRKTTRVYFGGTNDIPVSGRVPDYSGDRPLVYSSDYNGDGTDDVAIFRPSTGLWAIRGISRIYFGHSDDSPAPGDYAGDGTTRISIYRSQGSIWKVRNLTQVSFGSELSGDTVPADYTGDGICDMAFFDDGLWTVRIQFPLPDIIEAIFGQPGDQPVPGNYGGTDSADLAIFRPSTGLWAAKDLTRFYFGRSGDIGMPADYTGDGLINPAIYRPATGQWIVRNITTVDFGYQNGVIPVAADFNGDGRDGMGLFRPSYGIWQIHDYGWFYFGGPDDLPVSGSVKFK